MRNNGAQLLRRTYSPRNEDSAIISRSRLYINISLLDHNVIDIIENIELAKVHLNKFSANAEPFQHSSHTINPIVIMRGDSDAAKTPCSEPRDPEPFI
jgi:hypothetical protein